MDFEKRNSKGSFLQLFDWNVKSKKKLFSSKSELPEKSSQGDENVNCSTFSRPQQVHENGYGPEPSIRGRCNLGYEFPLSSDDTYGTKAPGVVARLMGLDSLPTSNNVESSFLDSQSFRDSRYTAGVPGSQDEEYIIIGDSMRNKVDGFAKTPVELMVHKVHSRPIERFQTEVLPPKSAKPISITHHRLLSPIKSPGFVPKMNAAYLMEAAGKMIEQSPQARVTHKLPSLGSSSVPFRIQDLKERVEAVEKSRRIIDSSQMSRHHNYDQYTNRHASGSVQGRVDSQDLLRANRTVKTASCEDVKRKTKAATLAERNGLTSVDDQGSASLGQRTEATRRLVGRNQEEKQINGLKRTPANRKSDALRQNNQKQNCASTKEKASLRPSIPNEKEKKPSSSIALPRSSKTVNRILLNTDSLCKKPNPHTHDSRVETSSSMMKNSSRKKPEADTKHVSDGGNVTSASHKSNYEIGKASKRESADRRNGMDVVSFTFTSPIKKPVPESTLSGKHVESKRNLFLTPDSCNNPSSLGLDVGGTDALSMLLEQKIKELACPVESSYQEPIYSEFLSCYADASTDSVPTVETISFKNSEWNSKCDLFGGKTDKCSPLDASSSSLSEPSLESMQKWQESDEAKKNRMVRHNEKEHHFEYSVPVSSPEPSYLEGSCKSLDSSRSISNQGSKRYLSAEALDTIGWSSNRTCQGVDIELLDSASSTSVETTSITDVSSRYASIIKDSSNWEFHYIRSVVFSTDLMFEEFALGQVQKVIPQDIFDQLENEKCGWNQKAEGDLKLTRQTLFDYVEESLESRCSLLLSGGRKHSMKVRMLFHQKDWLVDELYREVSGWSGMEELIVDEVVDKDMSTQLGRWADFETETFEEGVEIGKEILTSLVDEMLVELFS